MRILKLCTFDKSNELNLNFKGKNLQKERKECLSLYSKG